MTSILAPIDDATARFDDDGFEWGMALIQVPDVRSVLSQPTRIDAWERSWSERTRPRTRVGRPRRRLRREFRTAACVCLVFAPIATAIGAWGLPPVRSAAAALVADATNAEENADAGSMKIRLSIKPVEAEPEIPVVFPGYLLPDEHPQESSHEGS
ncbi:hypothetical protein [Paludisphaera rhizosphaerae]|uniref:hypothetical protein n=1 Tax=Paludisphaera rhizosphaerae TaxID=2711216 RepID=UPI0013EA1A47|nr:hypothetical protein [Paludisphaera rhizosphaerae]